MRGIRNVGMYRVQQLGRDTLAMHWQRHKMGAAHWREMAERGEKMPVCIAIGADPAVDVLGVARRCRPTIDEFLFAGFLRKAPVKLAKARDLRPRGAGRRGVRDRRATSIRPRRS